MTVIQPRDMENLIRQAVDVDPQLVLLAKVFLSRGLSGDASTVTDAFLAHVDAGLATPVLVHASVPAETTIAQVARHLSAKLALAEAVWALIGAGLLVPRAEQLHTPDMRIAWTTVVPGSGGESSGWDFGELAVPMPRQFAPAPSFASRPRYLTDGDLYVQTLGVPVHPMVEEALRDAVRCFRADLYLPAVTMLGRAAEGLWLLLGDALVTAGGEAAAAVRFGRMLDRLRFAKLVDEITSLYEHQDLFADLATASGVSLEDLRQVRLWTHEVRDSRNVVHFSASTPVPNTYEKVAALLLGAVPNFRALVRLADAAASRTGGATSVPRRRWS